MKILIVDDSATVRAQAGRALRQAGFTVVEAGDGLQALDRLAEPGAEAIALIVCDLNMPNMGGIELLEVLHQRGNGPPTLMLTTEAHPKLIQQARAAGAKAWIIKPFKADVLVAAASQLAKAA